MRMRDREAISLSRSRKPDEIEIWAWCAFCGVKMVVFCHEKKDPVRNYFCSDECRSDYRILRDPKHPQHTEIVERHRRMFGREQKKKG